MEPSTEHDDRLFGLLASIKDNFWNEHRRQGIPDSEIRQLWGQRYVDRLAPVLGFEAPSSIFGNVSESLCEDGGSVVPQPTFSPQSQGMSRSRTKTLESRSTSTSSTNMSNFRKRASSLAVASSDTMARPLRLSSTSADRGSEDIFPGRKMQRTASGSRVLPAVSEGLALEDPAEYLEKTGIGSYQVPHTGSGVYSSFPVGIPMSAYEPPPLASSLSCSFNQSLPLTPDSATMQNEAFFNSPMSRQGSLGVDFRSGFAMFRLDSQVSNTSEYAAMPQPPFMTQLNETTSEGFPSAQADAPPQPFSHPSYNAYESSASSQDAQVLPSPTAKHQHSSSARRVKSLSRQKSGYEGQPQSPERPLKPKLQSNGDLSASRGGHPMMRVESETGVAEKRQISKTPYNRPSKQKTMCTECDKHPEGFRGDHELRRHQKLHHSNTRIGWICVDVSPDESMLSGCKHCRSQKVYGAYYNAAAHLRRVHFHPRKEGRKARGCVSRAGKGGGDDPPMDELKRWMKQVKVTETSDHALHTLEDVDFSFEDQEQPALKDGFLHKPSDIPFGAEFSLVDGFDDIGFNDTNFAFTRSGYPWPSEDAWTGLQQSSAFKEADIFSLDLSYEV